MINKQQVDEMIGIWLRDITSTSHDAGWEGESMLSRLITYKGQPPEATGMDRSNAAMMKAMRLMKGRHHEFPSINAIILELLEAKYEETLSLLAKNYYVHLNLDTGRSYTDYDRAGEIGQKYSTFRANVTKGYKLFIAEYEKFLKYSGIA